MAAGYAFSIDLDRCIGCRACVVACGTGNALPPGGAYIQVSDVVRRQSGGLWGSFAHHRCFHCGAAPCVEVCPTGALSRWKGLTAVAAEKCSGCGYCTDACPFQVPRLQGGQVSKCLGCLDLVQDGRAPWCEQTCPSRAIRFGEREAILAEAQAQVERLRASHPEAQVYGESQLGGLGLLLVLLDRPERYGLPEEPRPPAVLHAWRSTVRPAAGGLSALAAVTMGLTFIVARRQHLRERAEGHEPIPPAPAAPPPVAPPGGPGRAATGASPRLVQRYLPAQRLFHWVGVAAFLALLASGAVLLFPPLARLAAGGLSRWVHRLAAVPFAALPLAYALLLPRQAKELLSESLTYGREDWEWLRRLPGYLLGRTRGLPPQGRLNAGQKLHHAGTFLLFTTVSASGFVLWLAKGQLGPSGLAAAAMVHDLSMLVLSVLLVGHVYFTFLYDALSAMRTGYVTEEYARMEHRRWFQSLTSEASARSKKAPGGGEEGDGGSRPAL